MIVDITGAIMIDSTSNGGTIWLFILPMPEYVIIHTTGAIIIYDCSYYWGHYNVIIHSTGAII